jgi:mono/diheme cytochrome c family protein
MRRVFALVIGAAFLLAACGGGDDGGTAETGPIAAGENSYGSTCAVCHGSEGQGGVGRPLDTVVADFPDCADQVRWMALGSSRWKTEVGPTFGASETPVSGGMPEFEATLSDEEIRAIAAFTRVRFAGQPEADAVVGCGA